MWNLRLQERDLSSYSLQMWAPTPRPVQLGAPAVHLVAMGLVRIQESAVLKPNLSCLREAWREPPPLQSHAQPRSIPPARCKSFSVVEESGALLRLPQPSNELCHNSPPPPQKLPLLSLRQRDSKQWKLIQRVVRLCERWRAKKS